MRREDKGRERKGKGEWGRGRRGHREEDGGGKVS